MEVLQTYIWDHWPFIAAALIFAVTGQVMKSTWLTKEKASKSKVIWWARKTMPLHPVLAGCALGAIPGIPISSGLGGGLAIACLYFAFSGVVSTWLYSAIRGVLKRRGIDIAMPGYSDPPGALNTPPSSPAYKPPPIPPK